MVKLVRLTSDGKGIFKSAFGNDMKISKDAKMALLNLTFKTEFTTITLTEQTGIILTQSDTTNADSIGTSKLVGKTYTKETINTLPADLQFTLNNSLELTNPMESAWNGVSSQIAVYLEGDKYNIAWRYCPFINPLVEDANPDQSPYYPTESSMYIPSGTNYLEFNSTAAPSLTTINMINGKAARTDSVARIISIDGSTGHKFSKGSGLCMLRIADSTDNGSGLQNNGGLFGLTTTILSALDENDDIPTAAVDIQIRYNRPAENYKYIINGAAEVDSGIVPQQVSITTHPTLNDHDILFIQKSGADFAIGVLQIIGGVATKSVFTTVAAVQGKDYFPYMAVRGTDAHIKFDSYNWSIDPWIDGLPGDPNLPNTDWGVTNSSDSSGYDNGYGAIYGTTLGNVLPDIDMTGSPDRWGVNFQSRITLHNAIWNSLGFTQVGQNPDVLTGLPRTLGFSTTPEFTAIWKADSVPTFLLSDNFMVISDTLLLDSFDASQYEYGNLSAASQVIGDKAGRRQNILMTIPVNDNTSGLVEYQASTPIYININNASPQNVKNLNFRILSKDFSPVKTNLEHAVMTILIDG